MEEKNQAVLLKMTRAQEAENENGHAHTDHEGSSGPEGCSAVEESSQEGSQETIQNDHSLTVKFKRCFKKIYKVSSSLVGLIIILIAFSFLGAFIFMVLEAPHEKKYKGDIIKRRAEIIGQMLQSSKDLTNQATDNKSFRDEMEALLLQYEADVMEAYKHNVKSSSQDKVWDFWSSLFFAGTVYTTIGYGHMAPVTDWGRLACMIYAGVGIPLALLVFADLGKRFTMVLKIGWAFVRRYYYTGYCRRFRKPFQRSTYDLNVESGEGDIRNDNTTGEPEVKLERSEGSKSGSMLVYGYEVDDEFNIPITVAIAILFIYIFLGSMMYTIWEEWSFLESFYFVFISISTIGFGDVIPAHPKFFILSFTYIFIGLSLVSMCVNVAIEFFSNTVNKAKAKMDEAKKRIEEARKMVTQAGKQAKTRMHEVGKNLKTNIAEEVGRHRKFSRQERSHSNTPVPPDTLTS